MSENGKVDSRQLIIWAFKLQGCRDCGKKPPDEISFTDLHCHHRYPETKMRVAPGGVGEIERHGNGGMGRLRRGGSAGLLEELAKCDVVCRDCHLERHRHHNGSSTAQGTLFMGVGKAWIYE